MRRERIGGGTDWAQSPLKAGSHIITRRCSRDGADVCASCPAFAPQNGVAGTRHCDSSSCKRIIFLTRVQLASDWQKGAEQDQDVPCPALAARNVADTRRSNARLMRVAHTRLHVRSLRVSESI